MFRVLRSKDEKIAVGVHGEEQLTGLEWTEEVLSRAIVAETALRSKWTPISFFVRS